MIVQPITADHAVPNRQPSWRRLLWLVPLAAVLAGASFANAAAQMGAAIPALASLGPSFHGWQVSHSRAERSFIARPSAAAQQRLRSSSVAVAQAEPLALPAWRSLALVDAATGRADRARGVMLAADRLSRRDPIVQAWLIDDGIRRRDIAATLGHFDALLRTEPEAREPLLTRLIGGLSNAAARRDLVRFVSRDTPWYPDFAGVAVRQSARVAPLALVLADAPTIPDSPLLRMHYSGVVERLVREGEFVLLRRLYPRLPGTQAASLTTLSLADVAPPPYPPVGWALVTEPDRNASIVDSEDGNGAGAIEAIAEPLISGLVARRLVYPPSGARRVSWRVVEREGWRDSTASLRIRCLDAVAVSDNLFDRSAASSLTLPRRCPVAMVEIQMFGGTGRDPAMLLIDRIALSGTPATSPDASDRRSR